MMQPIPGAHRLHLCGQTIDLLPQRAIYWYDQQTLIVADVHLGKAQTFQRAGLPVSGATLVHDLVRLENLSIITSAQRLLVLGDFVHHHSGLTQNVREKIRDWCARLDVELLVIIGNHDRPNRKFLAELPLILLESAWQCGPFEFSHEYIAGEKFRFIGHLHPVLDLRSALRLPVFAFYRDYCVLPAFSYFTGGWPIERRDLAQVFVPIGDEQVLPLGG